MTEAGWQADPTKRFAQRYFDGTRWTDHVADAQGVQSIEQQPPPPPTPPAPQGPTFYPDDWHNPAAAPPERPWWKKKRVIIPAALLLLFVIIGVASGGEDGDKSQVATTDVTTTTTASSVAPVPTTEPDDGGVTWSNYAPAVRTRIDDLAAAKDCAGLQKEFDTAEKNDAATRARTGEGNAKLMSYIDAKLKAAGCY